MDGWSVFLSVEWNPSPVWDNDTALVTNWRETGHNICYLLWPGFFIFQSGNWFPHDLSCGERRVAFLCRLDAASPECWLGNLLNSASQTGLWLVNTDHVTSILASDWSLTLGLLERLATRGPSKIQTRGGTQFISAGTSWTLSTQNAHCAFAQTRKCSRNMRLILSSESDWPKDRIKIKF